MIRFILNGAGVSVDATPDTPLTSLLREGLALTGTKTGCGIGRCGACMVLRDGQAVNGCLLMGWQVEGRSITTIEGVDALPVGPALKRGLAQANAFQCGHCAPGVVMTLAALFTDSPSASEAEIGAALAGNLCRCTGYLSILRGALAARDLIGPHPPRPA